MNTNEIQSVANGLMSVLFYECQPDKGDVFAFCDDIKEKLAQAAISASNSVEILEVLKTILWRHDDGQQGYQLHPECAKKARDLIDKYSNHPPENWQDDPDTDEI